MANYNDSNPVTSRQRLARVAPYLNKRAKVIDAIRKKFESWGFLEVETPTRIPAPAPESHIDAEPSGKQFLVPSPELQMKQLLAAGYDKIFQICHCFRQGERGDTHLPEFTMLEWYRLNASIINLMGDCEQLVESAAKAVQAYPTTHRQNNPINLSGPWERLEVADAFERYAGWRPGSNPDPNRFDVDLVSKVEPGLPPNRPVFLVGYPAAMASLAKLDETDTTRAERFELYAGGLELANGFTELTDPKEQRDRFEKEKNARSAAKKTVYPLDENFLGALEQGLGPCAGIAMGLDRLVMVLTGASVIDDVVAFPEGTL
ncbi:MAG: EF-P lysine aminoacylase GenX [Proteobacteria bacterium]|nr:EF-P lysine aminoacylase GenX [Pseudomonadota bacterium]